MLLRLDLTTSKLFLEVAYVITKKYRTTVTTNFVALRLWICAAYFKCDESMTFDSGPISFTINSYSRQASDSSDTYELNVHLFMFMVTSGFFLRFTSKQFSKKINTGSMSSPTLYQANVCQYITKLPIIRAYFHIFGYNRPAFLSEFHLYAGSKAK